MWQSHYTCHLVNAIHCHLWIWEWNLICSVNCWELTEAERGHSLLCVSSLQSLSKCALIGTPEPWHILLLLFFSQCWWVPVFTHPPWKLCRLAHRGLECREHQAHVGFKHLLVFLAENAALSGSKADTELLCPPREKVRETQHIPHNLRDCFQNQGQATFSCTMRGCCCCWISPLSWLQRGSYKQGCETPWAAGPGTSAPCHLPQNIRLLSVTLSASLWQEQEGAHLEQLHQACRLRSPPLSLAPALYQGTPVTRQQF